MGKGNPPPFVVARGDDRSRVLEETLKYTGFFDLLEQRLLDSGRKRTMFRIVAKVDFECALAKEDQPLTYVDPELVRYLFDQLLDRGFRLLKVVGTTNECARYQANRDLRKLGGALGYDESCYELADLSRDLVPVDFGSPLGKLPTGRAWHEADFRIVIGKNRTHELFGPTLLFYNLFHTLATPTDLLVVERGIDMGAFVPSALQTLPVDFGIVDATTSLDGTPGGSEEEVSDPVYELLAEEDGNGPRGPVALASNTLIAGRDVLAVEAAGCKMQGLEPLQQPVFKTLRRGTAYRPPAEVDTLPVHDGWQGIGERIRQALDPLSPVDAFKVGLWRNLEAIDLGLFPRLPAGYPHVRLEEQARDALRSLRRDAPGATAATDAWSAD